MQLYNGHVSSLSSVTPPCLSLSISPPFQNQSPSPPSASTANSSKTVAVPRYGPSQSRKYLFKVLFFLPFSSILISSPRSTGLLEFPLRNIPPVPRQEPLAQPVPRRLPPKARRLALQETSRKPYPGSS